MSKGQLASIWAFVVFAATLLVCWVAGIDFHHRGPGMGFALAIACLLAAMIASMIYDLG